MKRVLSLISAICLVLALLLCCSLSAFAAEGGGLSGNPLVVDNAGLLTAGEREALEAKARSISETYGCEVVILTINGTDGKSLQDYSDDYFVYQGYGYGEDRSGILFVMDMNERDTYFTTCGAAIKAFTDDDIDYIADRMRGNLSAGNYYSAFETYHSYAEEALETAANSKPNYVKKGIISIVLGAVGGFLPASAQKSSLKTVRRKRDASGYAQEGSLNLTVNRDVYLYSNVTSHVIQRVESGGGGGGHTFGSGHSSTHTHSSGTTLGGHGGGKF